MDIPKKCFHYRKWILSSIFLFVSFLFAVLLVMRCFNLFLKPSISDSVIRNSKPSEESKTPNVPDDSLQEKIYFGQVNDGKSTLTNMVTGREEELVPSGYQLVEGDYGIFPTVLLLEKEKNLFKYDFLKKSVQAIPESAQLKLGDLDKVFVNQSFTEKDKFLLIVERWIPKNFEDCGMMCTPSKTQRYFLDISVNRIRETDGILYSGVFVTFKYDSANKRIFSWYAGEGAGSIIPVDILNLSWKYQKNLVSLQEFGIKKESQDIIHAHYNDGRFFVLPESKIIVYDVRSLVPTKTEYFFTEKTQFNPYSVAISEDSKTIILGEGNSIDLFRFDDNNTIIESKSIEEPEVYANFIFVNKNKLYYRAKDALKVINLDTWTVEKSFPSQSGNREITIFLDGIE